MVPTSTASPALPGAGRVDRPHFGLGHAFLIALVLHLLLVLVTALFPGIFAVPVRAQPAETSPPPVKFTFIDVPDDHVVAENPDADLISDKAREEAGPTPAETTPEGKEPPSAGNTRQKVISTAEREPSPPVPPAPQQLPRTAAVQALAPAETPPPPDEKQGSAQQSPMAQKDQDGPGERDDRGRDRRPVDPRQQSFSRALDRMAAQPLPTDLQAVAPPEQTPPRRQTGKSTQWQFNNPDPAYPVKVGSISFDSKEADFGPWLAEFHRRVLAEWNSNIRAWHEKLWREIVGAPQAPDALTQNAYARRLNSTRGVTGIVFLVTREGSVIDLEMVHPSGTVELDRSVQKTLRNVLLPPLPPDYPDEVLPIRAGFYYNVEPPE